MPRMGAGRFAAFCGVAVAALTATGIAPSSWTGTSSTPAAQARQDRPALSPAEALASFVLEPGYRIDLVASEPLVQSPVAMGFDDRGRLYVAENRGYPDPLDGERARTPEGVVALLTDTDGDGRYDARTDFATGLTYPNGVMPWDGGVFVTMAPDLLYLKDTTGDGVADERRVVLTGFNTSRTAQIRFSHPTLGPDGWIYLTSGLNGGRVTAPADPARPAVEFTSSDSRFNPRTGEFELAGGQGQYGLTFDDYGRRFICANRNPVWHVVLEPRQLTRNPNFAFSDTVHEVSTAGVEAKVWPLSRDLTTASFHPALMTTPHAGTFTSASGVHIHRGDALPEGHRGSVFIAESAQNLVQRQVREPDGVSFRSRPAREGAEFLAARDTWFRPVFAGNGPDGALYIVDMYRKDIDHPAYIPESSRQLFAFTAGKARGRIYRLAAADRPPVRMAVNIADAPVEALVPILEHPNAWWRETAGRRLIERGAQSAEPRLRALAADGTELGRLHALWTMDALGMLEDADIVRAVRDPSAGIRENAVRLAERRIAGNRGLIDAVLPLADDADARVRLHVALAIGAAADARVVDALAAIARRDGGDRWVRAAIFSGLRDRASAFLHAFVSAPPTAPAVRAAVMQDLGRLFGTAESADRCLALVAEVSDPDVEEGWQAAALNGIAAGLRARGMASGTRSPLMTLVSADTPQGRVARERLAAQMAKAAALAVREDAPAEQRLPAIELLGHGDGIDSGATLRRLLEPQRPTVVQVAAVRALVQLPDPAAAAILVEPARWQAYTPRLREAVLSALLSEDRLVFVLLDAVARRDVNASALGASRWRRLTSHRDPSIRTRAEALHSAADTRSAMQAYERRREDVLARAGDPTQGAAAFAKHCTACHTFNGSGGRVGPDLSGIRNQPPEAILLHIVVPDYEITPGYEAYMVETRNGKTIFGRLESEAPASTTVRDAAGQAHAILRTDIASMAAAPASLMPAGLDQAMSSQELAGLLAYLKSAGR
ncbi:MAG: PVC-type heme-binding CxxCH protein [Vicinamibacterales bacterium]